MERYWDGGQWTDDVRPRAMAPPTGPATGRTDGGGGDWKWLLFSFEGRAHRAHFWTGFGVSLATVSVAFAMLVMFTVESDFDGNEPSGTGLLAFFALWLLALWVYVAVGVKRWHDRDKSGAWMFLQIVPFGPLWVLVECGCLPGTDGPNQYGGDPRRVAVTPY